MRRIDFGGKLLDRRWRASDQLIQLKGLVEFDERYRYWINLKDEIKIEEREEEIKSLSDKVTKLRSLLKSHEVADTEAIGTVLQQDREIFLICRDKRPEDIIENLTQMVFRKKLAVDKTFFDVKKKEKELYDIQSEISKWRELMTRDEEIARHSKTEEQERYSAALEYASTQKDVCRITLETYRKLTGILKNDSYYFDELLGMLEEDALVQSSAILGMLASGQSLSGDLSWLHSEGKRRALRFQADTRGAREEIRRRGKEIKQLSQVMSKLADYAAFDYPLFQEVDKARQESGEEVQVRSVLTELDDFIAEWNTCLDAQQEDNFFTKLLKAYRLNGTLQNRLSSIRLARDFVEESCGKLSLVKAELDNCIDEEVRRDLDQILEMENELETISDEMKSVKEKEDEIRRELELYEDYIYQFKRLLSHVMIGPPFGADASDENDKTAVNALRFENPEMTLVEEQEVEKPGGGQEGKEEDLARTYLDPQFKLDWVQLAAWGDQAIEAEDPIETLDNVLMRLGRLVESLPPDRLTTPPGQFEELTDLGDFYSQKQLDIDTIVQESSQQEKIAYKRFKPTHEDFHKKKNCSNKSRLELKRESGLIVLENEGPQVGLVLTKGALHPPGVIRGMYIPETDAEEEEEEEAGGGEAGAGARAGDAGDKGEGEDEEVLPSQGSKSISSTEGSPLLEDSDLDPNLPKPHVCIY